MDIFVSYSRQNNVVTKIIVNDLESLGNDAWFDQELSGGQSWWDKILESIRNCDVFVLVLGTESLKSGACISEYKYAIQLGKPVLPILVSEGVKLNLLPSELLEIQYVDYRKQDRESALRLAKAVNTLPPTKKLPKRLPDPPAVPVSYLVALNEKVACPETLDYDAQSGLLFEIKSALRDPESDVDARTLLLKMKERPDLLAKIAVEIEEILDLTSDEPDVAKLPKWHQEFIGKIVSHKDNLKDPNPSSGGRIKTSLISLVLGTVVGIGAIAMSDSPNNWPFGFVMGILLAIAGLISGKNKPVIIVALTTALIFGFLIFAFNEKAFLFALVAVAPVGAIIGAIIGLILKKLMSWR